MENAGLEGHWRGPGSGIAHLRCLAQLRLVDGRHPTLEAALTVSCVPNRSATHCAYTANRKRRRGMAGSSVYDCNGDDWWQQRRFVGERHTVFGNHGPEHERQVDLPA